MVSRLDGKGMFDEIQGLSLLCAFQPTGRLRPSMFSLCVVLIVDIQL